MAEIAQLTDRQLYEVFFSEPAKPPPARSLSPYEAFRWVWKHRGWADPEIRQRWEQKQLAVQQSRQQKKQERKQRRGRRKHP